MTLDDPLLGLTVRTLNSLLRAGFATVAEVDQADDDDLLAIRQFGRAQLGELRAKTAQYRTIAAVTACPLRLPEPGEIPVRDLEITARTRDRLLAAGLTTAADVEARTEADLLGLPGFGATCLADYKRGRLLHAARHGICLDPDALFAGLSHGARTRRWWLRHALVAAYVAEHGVLPSSRAVVTGPAGERICLGSWLAKQRDLHRRGALPPHRVSALTQIEGWRWDVPTGRRPSRQAA